MSFVVFSLPRSRSTWLSAFLSYGGRIVHHDLGPECDTPEAFIERLGNGTCETGAAFAWRLIRRMKPDCKFVVVKRDPSEVCESLERFGLRGQMVEMISRFVHLSEIAIQPGTLYVEYARLGEMETCKRIFEFCLDEPFDRAWWERLDAINIQVDMPAWLRHLSSNRDRIEALKADVRRRA